MKGTVDVFSLVLTGPENAGPRRQAGRRRRARSGGDGVRHARQASAAAEPARTVKARPDGSFTVRFRATAPGAYRATVGKAASPVVSVAVVPRLAVVHTANVVQRDDRARAGPARRVALQAYDRDHFTWRTIARARLDGSSRARLAIPAARPIRLRVVVRGDEGWADGATKALLLAR